MRRVMIARARGETADMPTSLYDLTVANYLQTVTAVGGFLDKGLAHFQSNNVDPNEVVETRLYADMLPFRFQIVSVAHHSLGAIEGLKKGVFSPPGQTPPLDYAGLRKVIADTTEGLQRLAPAEVNALEGRDMAFQFRDRAIPFAAESFILSFSLPNFYFHAATAYDILRNKGVPLGKRDFLGRLRIKA
jgi:hypothetical protein